uniref:receptor protein serine/threonine kinase n=1 Tax=Leptobrachium leishanense TaxID=445787 RepID=A0A8C5M8H4_9ANUR
MGMLSAGLGLSLLMISSTVLLQAANPKSILCEMYENTSLHYKKSMHNLGEPIEPGIIRCNSCCMAVWKIHKGELQPGLLGCYPDRKVCASPVCTPVIESSPLHYCFCSSNMCNSNITIPHQRISRDHFAVYSAIAILFLVFCVAVFIKALRKFQFGCLIIRKQDDLELQEIITPDEEDSPPTLPVDGLVLVQPLREERLAAHLWLGVLHGRSVIIKGYPPHLKELYRNEWKIINLLARFQHENIVRLLAAGSGMVGSLENHQFLVLQHYPQGSLRNYLTGHTTDWTTAYQLAVSLTRGLAFLHTYTCGDTQKPSIAHRDLNSDNVLVTERSSCIISDFGLSVILERQQMKSNNKQDPAKICMSVALWEMLEDCWDADSEARLSAHCAQQRLWNIGQTTLHQCCEEP